jgi:hypothetical protein
LCRWFGNIDFQYRNNVFMVEWGYNPIHYCNNCGNIHGSGNQCCRMSKCGKCCYNSNRKPVTCCSNYHCRWCNHFLCRRFGNTDFKYRNYIPVVEWSYKSIHYCNNCRNIYRSGNKSFELSKPFKCRYCGNSKCFTCCSDNYGRWCNYVLCRRFGNIDFQYRKFLLVVERCYNPIHLCNYFRNIYRSGYECFKLPKCCKYSYNDNCQPITCCSNHYSKRCNLFLCRRFGNTDFQYGNFLLVVNRGYISIH